MAVEDGDDLACDSAWSEVARGGQTEFCGEAELAVDGAADLRRDTDGGAGPVFCVIVGVAGFAAVAFGHPDGFNGGRVAGTTLDKVALGSITGLEGVGDSGAADLPALFGQAPT